MADASPQVQQMRHWQALADQHSLGEPEAENESLDADKDAAAGDVATEPLPESDGPPLKPMASSSSEVIQAKIGFELELLALVDVEGRPPPEKTFLGSYGAQNLELQVDHGAAVAAATPTPAADADFSVATRMNPQPQDMASFGAYDLPIAGPREYQRSLENAPGVADPRSDVETNILDLDRWQRATNHDWYDRTATGQGDTNNNQSLATLDTAIKKFEQARLNWEAVNAQAALLDISVAAHEWLLDNPTPVSGSLFGPKKRAHARKLMNAVIAEAQTNQEFWANPANANPPPGINRAVYRQRQRGAGLNRRPADRAWGGASTRHPIAGAGNDRYASILEIVTPPYEPETDQGRADLATAMGEAVNLAAGIENATGNFANRARFDAIPNVNLYSPETFVGNDAQPAQTTDASIQSTFAIDLAQLGSFVKSTVTRQAPQTLFSVKHQADTNAAAQREDVNLEQVGSEFIAAREMTLALRDARRIIGDLQVAIGGDAPQQLNNLRGLIILMCQYLRLGKFWSGDGVSSIDKNLTDLLSRTDLAQIYRQLVPDEEKAWIGASRANRASLIASIFAQTGRTRGSVLLNQPDEARAAGRRQFGITCEQFVTNILTAGSDGITPHLGGFRQLPAEDIDPEGRRDDQQHRPADAAHRMGPIFEMRNMIPKVERLNGSDRFPKAEWVPLAAFLAETLNLLNARSDTEGRDAVVGPPADDAAPAAAEVRRTEPQ